MTSSPEPSDPSPHALTTMHVKRAVAGDDQSLGWLVSRLSPLLVAQARLRLGAELQRLYDAEDLVHEAWLVTLPKLDELNAREGRLTPVLLRYLSTSLLYVIHNLARKQARRARHGATGDADLARVAARDSGVVSQVLRAERRDEVTAALDALPELDRKIVLLRGVEQLSHRAVASIVGLSEDAAGNRYLRALKKLRASLDASVFDELEDTPGD